MKNTKVTVSISPKLLARSKYWAGRFTGRSFSAFVEEALANECAQWAKILPVCVKYEKRAIKGL